MNNTITAGQVRQAAAAGVYLLNRETTMIPAHLKRPISLLEALLVGVENGSLALQAVGGDQSAQEEGGADAEEGGRPAGDGNGRSS